MAQSAVVVQPAPAAGVPTSRTPAACQDSFSRLPAFGHPAEMQAGIDVRMQPMHASRLPTVMTNAGHRGAYLSQRAGLQGLQTHTDASALAQCNCTCLYLIVQGDLADSTFSSSDALHSQVNHTG